MDSVTPLAAALLADLDAGVDDSLTRALRKASERLRGPSSVPTTYHPPPTT